MDVTRIRLQSSATGNPLCYATVTLGGVLVVHGVKLISLPADPPGGKHPYPRVFLTFPSHQTRRVCEGCHRARPRIQDRYCSLCGHKLPVVPPPYERYEDTHPITTEYRKYLTEQVVDAYREWARIPEDEPLPVGRFPSLVDDNYLHDLPEEEVIKNGAPKDAVTVVEERHQ